MDGEAFKILMSTDCIGGVWTYTVELCRALQPYNFEIHLLSLGATPNERQVKEIKCLTNVRFYPTDYKLEWMEDPWEDVRKTAGKIEALCRIIQPDLFHFNNYINTITSPHIPKITVYHSCVQTWWQSVKNCTLPTEWDGYIKHLQDACNSSNVVVFPTDAIRESAYGAHGITAPSNVIYNARDFSVTGDVIKENIILCTGRIWDEAKNLKFICGIADQIPWPIYVAGGNANPNTSERMVLDNVRFLGKLDSEELKYWLERTQIYVNPALYEPFGLAVLEAAKTGCALVLSNLETLKEVWQENALYFTPKNETEIVGKLLKLISDTEMRKQYQQKAIKHSKRYCVKTMGKSYVDLYHSLIQKKMAGNRTANQI